VQRPGTVRERVQALHDFLIHMPVHKLAARATAGQGTKAAAVTEPRIQPLMAGGRCVGMIMRTARGVRAFDGNDVEIGTYATAELAIGAITERARIGEKREASGAA
jgi:hypothetical protein